MEKKPQSDDRTPSKKILWEAAPPLPDPEKVIHDVSCQGSIGLALQQALYEESESEEEDQGEEEEETPSDKIQLDQPAIKQVLQSFGKAITQSQHDQQEMELNKEAKATGNLPAPAALLRGRVDHFNRLGGKWRLVVHDAKIIGRRPLDRNRRKRERPSLWRVLKEGQPEPTQIQRLEILAYNDIE